MVTSDFVNCTFAYNLTDASSRIGGIYSEGCRVLILNSVFYGNRNAKGDAGTALCANGGTDDISYTLLESTNAVWNAGKGTVSIGDRMQYCNPKFVTSLCEFLPLVRTNASGLVYLNWTNATAGGEAGCAQRALARQRRLCGRADGRIDEDAEREEQPVH